MKAERFLAKTVKSGDKNVIVSTIHSIAVGSVTLGIATIVLSIFILKGFQNKIQEKSFSFSGHLNIKKYTLKDQKKEAISFQSKFYENAHEIPEISHVQGIAYKQGLIKSKKGGVSGIILKGIDQSWDSTRFVQNIIRGHLPNVWTDSLTLDVMISQTLANTLNLEVGDRPLVTFIQNPPRFRRVNVVGIYEPGMEEFNDISLCDLRLLRQLYGWTDDQVGEFEVFLKDFDQIDDVYQRFLYQDDVLDNDLYAIRITSQYSGIFAWLDVLNQQVVIFMALILFIACFNMGSVLLVMIMDRTQMIGVLKTLGATNGLITRMFVLIGFDIILKGLLIGNGLALALLLVQDQFKIIPLDYSNYFMHYVPVSWEWGMLVSVNILVVVIITVTLLIPSTLIALIRPIKAIKFN